MNVSSVSMYADRGNLANSLGQWYVSDLEPGQVEAADHVNARR